MGGIDILCLCVLYAQYSYHMQLKIFKLCAITDQLFALVFYYVLALVVYLRICLSFYLPQNQNTFTYVAIGKHYNLTCMYIGTVHNVIERYHSKCTAR
jgi:hypothetical protein